MKGNKAIATILLIMFSLGLNAQTNPLGLEDLKQLAFENNIDLKIHQLQSNKASQEASAASTVSATQFSYNYFNDNVVCILFTDQS